MANQRQANLRKGHRANRERPLFVAPRARNQDRCVHPNIASGRAVSLFLKTQHRGSRILRRRRTARVFTVPQPMKILFLFWITIRGAFDASVWATAVWCLLYSFTNVLWPQCFWAFLAIHFLGNLPLVKYVSRHTSQDCFAYIFLEARSIVLSILQTPIIAVLPAVAAIVLLTFLQAWTNLETHWLHTCLFVFCLVYILLRGREKRRMARQANSHRWQKSRNIMGDVEQAHREEWLSDQEPPDQVTRAVPRAANARRSVRVIDV
jgi:hypothetical protein